MAVAGLILASAGWLGTRFDLLGQAGNAYARGQYRTALRHAEAHLKYFPGNRRASLMAARCLSRLGNAHEAEVHYRRAEPLDYADMQSRAYALVQAGLPEDSAKIYDQHLVRWPRDPLALKRLAAVRIGLKQWRAVLELADRLIAIPSEEVAGRTLAAIAHHEQKHYALAVAACRRALELDPDLRQMPLPRTLFWNNLALDLVALGEPREARRYLEQALAGSEDAGLMELLGLTYSHEGATDQAERCWRLAERWDPENADVCLDLGRLAMSRHSWSEAVDFLKRAAHRSPSAVEPLYNLCQAYRMLGNIAEAERYRQLADERRRALPRGGQLSAEVKPESAPGDRRAARAGRAP
jgi:tetratricopeptide (TPR) repeat protein